ncbi:MAG: AAA family ATPase [Parachlamydia sp.]|nr:AAA family ATPase [Parachlamydia sp.]
MTIIGNQPIRHYLEHMVATQAVNNSLLFAGPDGIGKSLFALELARQILGEESHPDLHLYRPEGKIGLHSIQSMRQMSEEVYMAPFKGKHKVFIIQDAERMLPTSANALLKTFEEPAADTLIVLISSAPASLLPTILSRCRKIYFHPLEEQEIAQFLQEKRQLSTAEAEHLAQLSQGSLGNAIRLLEQGGNQVRATILNQLAKGKAASYTALSDLASELAGLVQDSLKQMGATWRTEMLEERRDQLTSAQRQTLEKEVDGALAMREHQDAQALFDMILGWYRDMHLLHVNGNRAYLIHRDYEADIEQALQRGEILPLEKVQQALAEASLTLERSTPLHYCLETLLLKLRLF